MTIFNRAFEYVLNLEGGYSNNPDDPGGETRYGISEAVAREEGYPGLMQSLPLETAKAIYKRRYWDALKLDVIAAFSEAIAFKLFDTGVNMGTGTAVAFLQRALNALNDQISQAPNLTVDGVIGQKTLVKLSAFLNRRGKPGEHVLFKALNILQGVRYIELAEARCRNRSFIYGWLANRVQEFPLRAA